MTELIFSQLCILFHCCYVTRALASQLNEEMLRGVAASAQRRDKDFAQ